MNHRDRLRRRLRLRRRPSDRRGVLLLVVLSMLVLFLLVGTTFLITSGQYQTASKIVEKANRTTYQPADLLERALMQLVRDTNNANSVLRGHSLLRDLYGTDGFIARVLVAGGNDGSPGLLRVAGVETRVGPRFAGVNPQVAAGAANNFGRGSTNGQVVEFFVGDVEPLNPTSTAATLTSTNAIGLDLNEGGVPVEYRLAPVDGYYEGCLLTMLTGPCRGQSVRVLDYRWMGSVRDTNRGESRRYGRFRVVAPRRTDGNPLRIGTFLPETSQVTVLTDFVQSAALGHAFMVNGRPFNGAGVGFNTMALSSGNTTAPSPRLSALEGVHLNGDPLGAFFMPIALAPNSVHFDPYRDYQDPPNGNSDLVSSRVNVFTDNAGTVRQLTTNLRDDDDGTAPGRALYTLFAGPGDADESYDAADYQNMALASQALEPRLRGRVVSEADGVSYDPDAFYPSGAAPAYLDLEGVTIPSFHRPALANYWFHQLYNATWLISSVSDPSDRVRAILEPYDVNNPGNPNPQATGLTAPVAARIAAIKRKFLMRPLREDHPDFDGGNRLSRYGTAALRTALNGGTLVNEKDPSNAADDEITFPAWEMVGPWDVDNDGDGVPDSVWVDIGLPVQQTEDGRWYKPLAAVLVEDLDGRLNLNAHGVEQELAIDNNDRSNIGGAAIDANLAMDATLLANRAGDTTDLEWLRTSEQLPQGSGWGPAEVSLRPVLSAGLPLSSIAVQPRPTSNPPFNAGYLGNPQYDDYARLLYGRPDPADPAGSGRNVPLVLDVFEPFGRYGSYPANYAATAPNVSMTKPGRTLVPYARVGERNRDDLTPYDFFDYPFRWTGARPTGYNPSGFASAPDMTSSYASGRNLAGGTVAEDQVMNVNVADESPYEVNLSVEARKLPPVSVAAAVSSYNNANFNSGDVSLVDDAPFSPAELERLLRAYDADSETLPGRLWNLVDAFDPQKLAAQNAMHDSLRGGGAADNPSFRANTLQSVVASSQAAVNRRLVTTDSFDLPAPNENWADRLVLGADGMPGVAQDNEATGVSANDDGDSLVNEGDEAVIGYNAATQLHTFANGATATYDALFAAGCDDYVVVMREDPPSPARLTDYLRYRITLELLRKGVVTFNDVVNNRSIVDTHVGEVLHGSNTRPAGFTRVRGNTTIDLTNMLSRPPLFSFGGLLAPEVFAGRRMDLNRRFGDGVDNNQNGVVDDPAEVWDGFLFDPTTLETIGTPITQDLDGDRVLFTDLNGDGRLDFDDRLGNEPIVDNLWIDADLDQARDQYEHHPFDYTRGADANGRGGFVDRNGNGVYDAADYGVRDDGAIARQLFARHLYCLMLALMDENYLAPYDPNDIQVRHYLDPLSGSSGGGLTGPDTSVAFQIALERFRQEFATEIADGTITGDHTAQLQGGLEARRLLVLDDAIRIAQRKLTCRMVAQWAINVVDFRDPDAIQTPFEYDENPWDGWNVVDERHGRVYPIDGDLATDENLTMVRPIERQTTATNPPQPTWAVPQREFYVDANNPTVFREVGGPAAQYLRDGTRFVPDEMRFLDRTRGVVWGAERPEVLLTEGVAWHDRRLQDLAVENATGDELDGGQIGEDGDDDLDQFRTPKGYAYIEAFNPWIGDTQQPAEFYSYIDRYGNFNFGEPGVRFDRLSNAAYNDLINPLTGMARGTGSPKLRRSPVWRIACVEEHPLLRNATVQSPAGNTAGDPVGLALDDPVTVYGTGENEPNQYLTVPLENGPWVYSVDDQGLAYGGNATPLPVLPNAYAKYWREHRVEAAYALVTGAGEASGARGDADQIPVPTGVIEHAPTVPDITFPSFDRFAQPSAAQTVTLTLSSRVDGSPWNTENVEIDGTREQVEVHQLTRSILLKPTRFIERVFYMAQADPVSVRIGGDLSRTTLPVADLVDPGLRYPLLTYDVPIPQYPGASKFNAVASQAGVQKSLAGTGTALTVHASKFANTFDRLDLDIDGLNKEQDRVNFVAGGDPGDEDRDDSTDRYDAVRLAPLLPGRRAVIGTTGDVYKVNPEGGAAKQPTFTGADARQVADRYATIVSRRYASEDSPLTSIPDEMDLEGGSGPSDYAGLRRFEMIPSPNANRNQFAIRMNGFFESLAIRMPDGTLGDADGEFDPFNLTAAEAWETGDNRLAASLPAIVVPIDHFSVSEPLDQYLVRQIELDPALDHYLVPNYDATSEPYEDHFDDSYFNGDESPFDEPFDLLPELVENQTTPNYRSVHLERLANPLLPWNPPPTRPDGTPIAQHDPTIPVNPYLPVDARSLDLTAFNSFSSQEANVPQIDASTEYVHVEPDASNTGPESRHRRQRPMPEAGSFPFATLLGFVSNERGRPVGPFPSLWLYEPARLLWRQSGGSTFTESAHEFARNVHNGYLARAVDRILPASSTGFTNRDSTMGDAGMEYDETQLSEGDLRVSYREHFVDFPWRVTLGFASWLDGESYAGGFLGWFRPSVGPAAPEAIDVDGVGGAFDLIGRPKINDNTAAGNEYADGNGNGNGRPDTLDAIQFNLGFLDTARSPGAVDAREFMEGYLRSQALDNSTAPALSWPNRPFTSAGELLQVPAWGGSRMLTYFSVFNWQYTQHPDFVRRTQVNPYNGEGVINHDGLDYDPNDPAPDPNNRPANTFDGDFGNDGTVADTDVNVATGVPIPEGAPTNALRFRETLGHFGHLANFFQTARFPSEARPFSKLDANGEQVPYIVPVGASHYYRLLDYVCVPSRFAATDTVLNLETFSQPGMAPDDPRAELAAPFNRVDRYREPGRVNLNTIAGRRDAAEVSQRNDVRLANNNVISVPRVGDYWSEVYDGLMHRVQDASLIDYESPGAPNLVRQGHLGPAWRDVALSRRGYVQPGFDPTIPQTNAGATLASPRQNIVDYSPGRMHPDFPTLFANPFRAPGEGANVPLAHMVQTGVDATLLRAHPLSPGADGAWGQRGSDDQVVDKNRIADGVANGSLHRDDAAEAGTVKITLGGGATGVNRVERLVGDVVLSRFNDANGRRGALPDTFLQDAFVNLNSDTNPAATAPINPREVSPNQSRTFSIANAEISKRATAVPLFSGASLEPSLDTERNATTRFEPIQRLSSMTTTRSNVYAIWITIGYFEVKPAREDGRIWPRYLQNVDSDGDGVRDVFLGADANARAAMEEQFYRVYQDGWTLGEEIGRDTGDAERFRGFYIVDRTRPVAFKPGDDLNTSGAVILRRRIQ